jgi:flagellar assembly protein FliH
MAVIKRQHASGLLKEAIVLDLGDIAQQGARIEAAAHAKAKQIEEAAQQRADELTKHASAEGFEQGRTAGLEAGQAEGRQQGHDAAFQEMAEQLTQLQQNWSEAAQQWETQRLTLETQAQQNVIELALRLTEKIVHRAVRIDNQVVLDQVRAALTHALGDHDVTVRISPDDRGVCDTAMPAFLDEMARFKHISITEDSAIGRGGCVIDFGLGQVDATLETQLRRAVELLLPEAESEAEPNASDAVDETA